MKYSVIIPVYRVEDYLARCLESVAKQFYRDSEIILVDDGSPDECPVMCDEYSKKYSFVKVIHQKNGGLSSARNAGLYASCGEYVIFVDSDDFMCDEAYEIIDAYVDRYPYVEMFSFSFYSINPLKTMKEGVAIGAPRQFDKLYYVNNCDSSGLWPVWKSVYKRNFIKGLEFPVGRIHEDVYWTSKCLSNVSSFMHVDSPWYCYENRRVGSITDSIEVKSLTSMIGNFRDLFGAGIIGGQTDLRLRARVSEACFYSLRCFKHPGLTKAEKRIAIRLVKENRECFKYSNKRMHKLFYFCCLLSVRLSLLIYSILIK